MHLKFPAVVLLAAALLLSVAGGCRPAPAATQPLPAEDHPSEHSHEGEHEHEEHSDEVEMLTLPPLQPAALDGGRLRVVATTSIIGDVVGQVGGEAIALTVLMGPGMDPHSYQPSAQDLTLVEEAHVVFVNGWNLEEGLARDLEKVAGGVVAPVSAGISPLLFDEHAEEHAEPEEEEEEGEEAHKHAGADPHVWFSIHNVEKWVENIEHVLSALDPAHAQTYAANAEAYLQELEALKADVAAQLEQIPPEKRVLVTNHDSFSYFAHEYGFEILGTVIPASSTLAEPSAADLSDLIQRMQEHGVCAIFTETTVSDSLAQTIAAELRGCAEVKVIPLYTGALGPPGSGADSYLGMFRANIAAIVAGLR